MRTDLWLCALIGVASATAMMPEKEDGYKPDPPSYDPKYPEKPYEAKKEYPEKKDPYPAKEYKESKGYDEKKDPYPAKEYKEVKSYDEKPDPYPTKKYDEDDHYDDDDDDDDYHYDDDHKYAYAAKKKGYSTKPYDKGSSEPWRPKTSHPEFFSVRVDEKCDDGEYPETTCKFENYAIRLEQGIVIATPYNKWWDPKLPIFFVDDDTQLYTVSKKPLQLYVDTVTGALRYAPVGWLPPNSIAFSFYKTGNNPLGNIDPSPAHLSWPSTQGNTLFGDGPWNLCALGNTGQYQVFVSSENYESDLPSGVFKDTGECSKESLAAVNASPWKSGVSPY